MNVVLIGGSKGLGLDIHDALKERGHDVLALSRTSGIKLDLTWEEETIKNTMREVATILGEVDALVVSAGQGAMLGPGASVNHLKSMLKTNVVGPIACFNALIKPLLRSKGKAMFVSSTASRKPGAGSLAYYAATKGALNSWVINESRRMARKKVSMFVLQPGWFESPMTDEIKESEKNKSTRGIPFKEFGDPKEIAKLGADLLENSNWVTAGNIFEASGGA